MGISPFFNVRFLALFLLAISSAFAKDEDVLSKLRRKSTSFEDLGERGSRYVSSIRSVEGHSTELKYDVVLRRNFVDLASLQDDFHVNFWSVDSDTLILDYSGSGDVDFVKASFIFSSLRRKLSHGKKHKGPLKVGG